LSDKGVEILAADIGTHLLSLQELSISLEGCEKISDKSLEAIQNKIIRSMPNLRKLSVSFGG